MVGVVGVTNNFAARPYITSKNKIQYITFRGKDASDNVENNKKSKGNGFGSIAIALLVATLVETIYAGFHGGKILQHLGKEGSLLDKIMVGYENFGRKAKEAAETILKGEEPEIDLIIENLKDTGKLKEIIKPRKEFKKIGGKFVKGRAIDADGTNFSGVLEVINKDGKKSEILYQDGVLQEVKYSQKMVDGTFSPLGRKKYLYDAGDANHIHYIIKEDYVMDAGKQSSVIDMKAKREAAKQKLK